MNPEQRYAVLGELGYNAYCGYLDQVDDQGEGSPGWMELTEEQREGWAAGAGAIEIKLTAPDLGGDHG